MKKTVTKDYLAEKINEDLCLPKSESLTLVGSIFDTILEHLDKESIVKISGFGNFVLRDKKARPGRNPKTGEPVSVPGKYVPHFKPGRFLRERVNRLLGLTGDATDID